MNDIYARSFLVFVTWRMKLIWGFLITLNQNFILTQGRRGRKYCWCISLPWISGVPKKKFQASSTAYVYNISLAKSFYLKLIMFYTWLHDFIEVDKLWAKWYDYEIVTSFWEFHVRAEWAHNLCFTTITQLQHLKLIVFTCQYHCNPK